jgi:hypothetical protein
VLWRALVSGQFVLSKGLDGASCHQILTAVTSLLLVPWLFMQLKQCCISPQLTRLNPMTS